VNDFQKEHERQEYWRVFQNALDEAFHNPDLLHCPFCFHSYDLEELGKPHSEVHCIECLGQGRVEVMGKAQDFDQSEWYEEYIK